MQFIQRINVMVHPTALPFNDGVETWINADDSTVDGIELNAQYGWDNGLYVATNFTWTDPESTFKFDDDAEFTNPPKLADKVANINFGYDSGAWDIELQVITEVIT